MKLFIIKSRQDFIKIQSSFDRKIYSNNFVLLVRKNDKKQIGFLKQRLCINDDFCRFAPVITKKKCKLAVDRNKIKRIIRDIIRKIFKTNTDLFKPFTDYEIIAKNNIFKKDLKYTDYYKEIEQSIKSNNI